MRVLICLLLLTSVVAAKEFQVTDQEQINIQAICDIASTNPNVGRDARASISSFCVSWEKRVRDANQEQAPQDGKELRKTPN